MGMVNHKMSNLRMVVNHGGICANRSLGWNDWPSIRSSTICHWIMVKESPEQVFERIRTYGRATFSWPEAELQSLALNVRLLNTVVHDIKDDPLLKWNWRNRAINRDVPSIIFLRKMVRAWRLCKQIGRSDFMFHFARDMKEFLMFRPLGVFRHCRPRRR